MVTMLREMFFFYDFWSSNYTTMTTSMTTINSCHSCSHSCRQLCDHVYLTTDYQIATFTGEVVRQKNGVTATRLHVNELVFAFVRLHSTQFDGLAAAHHSVRDHHVCSNNGHGSDRNRSSDRCESMSFSFCQSYILRSSGRLQEIL